MSRIFCYLCPILKIFSIFTQPKQIKRVFALQTPLINFINYTSPAITVIVISKPSYSITKLPLSNDTE
jgi:hypothetical protein